MSLLTDLFEMNYRLTYDLWHLKSVQDRLHELNGRLVLPQKRDDSIRISEQEAKMLYCSIINNLNYYYSVETPTVETYMQTGQRPQSANSDVSLYVFDGSFKKTANVEFKSGLPNKKFIFKDIEKLVREKEMGVWVHLMGSLGSKSLEKLFDRFIWSFNECKRTKYLRDDNRDQRQVENIDTIFYLYSIRERWAAMKYFSYSGFQFDDHENSFMDYTKDFFKLSYKINKQVTSQTEIYPYVEVVDNNNWKILSMKERHDYLKA